MKRPIETFDDLRSGPELRAQDEEIERLKERLAKCEAELEQERVRQAGCLTAAEGATKDPAAKGQYGWSPAYQAVLDLRLRLEQCEAALGLVRKDHNEILGLECRCKLCKAARAALEE